MLFVLNERIHDFTMSRTYSLSGTTPPQTGCPTDSAFQTYEWLITLFIYLFWSFHSGTDTSVNDKHMFGWYTTSK